MSRKFVAVLSSLALGACSVFGVRAGTEEPGYSVVDQVGAIEIRQYGARIAAETTVDGDEMDARSAGFRRLAGYIFGANTTGAKVAMTAPVAQSSQTIAMTAPVAQQRDAAGRYVVRFFMPAKYTLQSLPVPNDPQVRLVAVAPETIAALRFSGSTSEQAVAEQRQVLSDNLRSSAWRPQGEVTAFFYDPPWTIPALRRNEVVVGVSK